MTSRPRIFGLSRDRTSTVVAQLFDGGANICITGDASCLIHAVDIPPMPITVATSDTTISIDDCCTKRGFIQLTLEDGNLYWQACYYCANIVETIICPPRPSLKLVMYSRRGPKPGSTTADQD
jgi:hypothetical protein